MALCFIEPELLSMEVLYCQNRDFLPFYSYDLDLDAMTFIYRLDPYCLEIYRMCKIIMNFMHQGFRKLSPDKQTDTTEFIYHAATMVNNSRYLGNGARMDVSYYYSHIGSLIRAFDWFWY